MITTFKKSTADHVMGTVLLEESLKKTQQKKAKNSFQEYVVCATRYLLKGQSVV